MELSRASKIHRGFYRIGVLLGALVLLLLAAIVSLDGNSFSNAPVFHIFWLGAATAFVYIIVRAIGWIVAGFVGD